MMFRAGLGVEYSTMTAGFLVGPCGLHRVFHAVGDGWRRPLGGTGAPLRYAIMTERYEAPEMS